MATLDDWASKVRRSGLLDKSLERNAFERLRYYLSTNDDSAANAAHDIRSQYEEAFLQRQDVLPHTFWMILCNLILANGGDGALSQQVVDLLDEMSGRSLVSQSSSDGAGYWTDREVPHVEDTSRKRYNYCSNMINP